MIAYYNRHPVWSLVLFLIVAFFVWAIFAAWPLRSGRWTGRLALAALLLAAAKLALGLTAPRYGLEASYYTNERFFNEPESSTAAPGTPYTRLDQALDFGSDEFPLFFKARSAEATAAAFWPR